jgi:hypothetical protein
VATHQVTVLLHRVRDGEPGALDELMPLVYAEPRRRNSLIGRISSR